MNMRLRIETHFDAAHFLPNYLGACNNLHGHTYKLNLEFGGRTANVKTGMICDFKDLKADVKHLLEEQFDHHTLNDVCQNPTAENLLPILLSKLNELVRCKHTLRVDRIELYEGEGAAVVWDRSWK